MKQMFNFYQLYIIIKADDVSSVFKKKENGLTHTLTIDLGNKYIHCLSFLERFEGVIPDLKADRDETF
jgi:hypothetical protein